MSNPQSKSELKLIIDRMHDFLIERQLPPVVHKVLYEHIMALEAMYAAKIDLESAKAHFSKLPTQSNGSTVVMLEEIVAQRELEFQRKRLASFNMIG